jgi:hypothetical protein
MWKQAIVAYLFLSFAYYYLFPLVTPSFHNVHKIHRGEEASIGPFACVISQTTQRILIKFGSRNQ